MNEGFAAVRGRKGGDWHTTCNLFHPMKTNCPQCNSYRVRPEQYRWYEAVLALVFLRPFRCSRCGTRFLRFAGVTRLPGALVLK